MDCIVHGVAKSRTWLSDFHFQSSWQPYEVDPIIIHTWKQGNWGTERFFFLALAEGLTALHGNIKISDYRACAFDSSSIHLLRSLKRACPVCLINLFPRAAVTKHHKQDGSINRTLFSQFHGLEVWKPSRAGSCWRLWGRMFHACLLPSGVAHNPWCCLACGSSIPVSASTFTFSLCLSSVSRFPTI